MPKIRVEEPELLEWRNLMEGLSMIFYNDKKIIYLDFSSFRDDKEKAKELIEGATVE
jgi:hypothetical protein